MFRELFGEDPQAIKPFCLLAPFYSAAILDILRIPRLKQGTLYACGHNHDLTFIHTRIGPTFLGDAVLHLEKTPCQNLTLLGACGATSMTPGMELGTPIFPSGSYAMDSFSAVLSKTKTNFPFYKSDAALTEDLFHHNGGAGQRVSAAASFSSFYLETQYRDLFLKKGIEVVDMETAALFQAAALTGKKAGAVLYVTDILDISHPFRHWSRAEKRLLQEASRQAASIILRTARQKNKSASN
ncbi:MAG TPA: hypothetical protein PLB05_09350 [Candidatus Omnitrophota bacterium]|nr:hypothetical protein [Candidatus Omnitrophota bacterium]HPN56471.1 hypothetical protein [Candidatus Omnitrophota bacterium]